MKKLLALALFVSVGTAQAQERIELKEVMITASAAGQENYKTGRSVEIISGEELNSLPVNSVDEMLRFVSGMNINSRGANGVQSDIGMRGSTFSQVLILIDNVRLNDPLTAHFNSNLPVSISEIDHIEITRGPASVSFGGDAVGGVINIITKTYCQNPGNEKLELVGNVNSGENHLRSTDVGAVVRRGKLSISASARTSSAFGEEMNNPNFEQGIAEDSLYHNDFDLRTYTASASYRFTNKLRVYARVGIDDRDFNAKYFYTRSAYDESREKTKNLWTQFSMIYGGDRHQIELNGGYKELEDYFEFNPLFVANEHTTKQTILNFSHRMQLNLPASFTYGVQVLNKSITSTDRGNHEDTNGGFYILYSQTFVKNLHFNASARAEYNEKFGVEILPQASLS